MDRPSFSYKSVRIVKSTRICNRGHLLADLGVTCVMDQKMGDDLTDRPRNTLTITLTAQNQNVIVVVCCCTYAIFSPRFRVEPPVSHPISPACRKVC